MMILLFQEPPRTSTVFRCIQSTRVEQLGPEAPCVAEGRMPVIVGTSAAGTRTVVHLSKMVEELGAAAVMVTPGREAVGYTGRIRACSSGG